MEKKTKPKFVKVEDWAAIDKKAASAIRLHLSDEVLNNVGNENSAFTCNACENAS